MELSHTHTWAFPTHKPVIPPSVVQEQLFFHLSRSQITPGEKCCMARESTTGNIYKLNCQCKKAEESRPLVQCGHGERRHLSPLEEKLMTDVLRLRRKD